jgi:peptide/nickel transport system permease protein
MSVLESSPGATGIAPAPAEAARRGRRVPWKLGIGGGIVLVFVVIAVLAPVLAPADPLAVHPIDALLPPGGSHPLGTDNLGRDELSRLLYAARIDLPVAAFGAMLPCLLGTLLGAAAGYVGGWVDTVVMRVADLVQAFPIYILMIALVFALGAGVRSLLIAFTTVGWVVYARLIRSEIVRIRHLDYVSAARAAGLSGPRILLVHILPNTLGQTIVYLMSDLVFAMLALASFSFLGLGISPPTAEWGAMTAAGQQYVGTAWWLTVLPGAAIAVLALGLSLIGDGVQDRTRS